MTDPLIDTLAEARAPVKTPCIGICSTTSVGDWVCRGCKRYSTEVIGWISFGEEEKTYRRVTSRFDNVSPSR